jgi:GAF domain-containing protein
MGSEDEAEILLASQALLQKLSPGDLDATLQSITLAAVEVLPHVHYSSITMRQSDGSVDSYAVSDDLLTDLDEQQFQLQEGPCYDASTDAPYIFAGDLGSDKRYPNYGPFAVRAGIRSQAGIPLFESNRTAGRLNLYSRQVGGLDHVEMVTRLFSHQAAVALSYSIEVTTLRVAVQTRTRIGEAVGIVMERYTIPEQRAFALLTRLSQTHNVKLRYIADEIIAATPGVDPL